MKIFISYRRDDSAGYAGRLFDHLSAHFGSRNVFMDIDTIQPGDDFRKVVRNAVGSCDVVLVLIGKQWLGIADPQGRRRLDDPRDWVRVEISAALANPNVRVIPVLLRGAGMPGETELPDDLKELSWRNAHELSDSRFQHDAGKLISVIERTSERPGAVAIAGRQKNTSARYLPIFLGLIGLGMLMGLAWYGLRFFGPTPLATPAPSFSATSMPTGIVSPTELPAPTFTVAPEPTVDVSTVVIQLVDNYFSCVNAAVQDQRADFEKCWNLLSNRPGEFQDYLNKNSGGFEKFYSNYWNQFKVSYALYYCPHLGQQLVDARLYYRDRSDPSIIVREQGLMEFYLAVDNGVWRIAGATNLDSNPGSDISSYCDHQPRIDKLDIFQ